MHKLINCNNISDVQYPNAILMKELPTPKDPGSNPVIDNFYANVNFLLLSDSWVQNIDKESGKVNF